MKATIALVFLGLVALSTAGLLTSYAAVPTIAHTGVVGVSPYGYSSLAYPYAAATYATGANYKLTLDTSLPGSAYASYPYAAAPTAYGYGVIKTL